ncbi:MAG: helix-turn-helix domain-containing protein [Lachnospiraceae bacterium]|nr:helix-turn-helix domain-containing protein [Lachnospiraceae bacterium]
MLSENIKLLRKQKGYTQETLAQQINVVRQTVSKWEKGISVPDAEMLNTLSDLFEVPVSRLLGSTIEESEGGTKEESSVKIDEVAKQLAILNEQLANQAVRRRKTAKTIILIIGLVIAAFVLMVVLLFSALILFRSYKKSQYEYSAVTIECELNGETYGYSMLYDQNFNIHEMGGDAFIINHVDLTQYSDVNEALAHIEDYFNDHGGSFKIVEEVEEVDEKNKNNY